ncbi:MAG: 4Fe-4S dicluster domain-containing protein [Burkholderiales bacterium]
MSEVTEGRAVPRWGMVIDLNRCVGCQTCTIACKHANDTTPGVQWRRVLDVEQGAFPDVQRLFLVVGCQHCADPPCVPVCPTGATRQRADGLVTMNYDVCIGCAYCAVSCPYEARTIVHDPKGYYGGALTRQEQATAHPERRGVAQKCTFCQGRIEDGIAQGLTPGVHPEATPACSAACIAQAIHFGDFNDAGSNVSRLLREQPSLQLNAGVGTDPQIKYLYTTPAVPGRPAGVQADEEERLADPFNPLVGSLQKFWDWRAAMNWILGGIGSGLAIATGLALGSGALDPRLAPVLFVAAAAIVSVGLFCVFLKIGRQARFWRAALRPHTSWMSRELYAAIAFYASVLAALVAPGPGPFALAPLSAAAFLLCQAKILHLARGIPAWRAPLVPWLLLASGLLEGCGALAAAPLLAGGAGVAWAGGAIIGLAVVNALLWRAYVGTSRARGIGPLARRVLARVTAPLHAIGHALPAVLAAAAAFVPAASGVLLALAGLAAIAGGALWKFALVVRAGYTQGFELSHLPQRGSGRRAAPPRLGGWTRSA